MSSRDILPVSGVTSRGKQRPVKLRNACNRCCESKVKCSGERTGCSRCQQAGSACIYAESRVGKVPGIRGKKKPGVADVILNHPQRQQNENRKHSTTASSEGSTIVISESDISADFDHEEVASWSLDWQLGSFHETNDFAMPATTESLGAPTVSSQFSTNSMEKPLAGATGTDINGYIQQADGENFLRAQLPESEAVPGRTKIDNSKLDGQCVKECCEMITDLEEYLVSQLSAFKIVLGVVRQTSMRIAYMIELQKASRNPRCVLLLSTLMYQIGELLEICHAAMEAERESQSLGPSTASQRLGFGLGMGMPAGLLLSPLAMDSDEEYMSRTRALLKEVHQILDILGKLRKMAWIGQDTDVELERDPSGEGSSAAVSQSQKLRAGCFHHLDSRLRSFAARLGNS